jgi:hypothetical protein
MRLTNKLWSRAVAAVVVLGAFALFVFLQSPRSPTSQTQETGQREAPTTRAEAVVPGHGLSAVGDAAETVQRGRSVEAAAPDSIGGSVLDLLGQRIAAIEIVGTPVRSADSADEVKEARSTSDAGGRYRIDGLEQGDYVVRSIATPQYPSTSITVRSGTSSADLVLAPQQELWVHGTVREGEKPLGAVRVAPGNEAQNVTYSDANGVYGLFMKVESGDQGKDALEYSLQGYSSERLPLRSNDPTATELALADVLLTRIRGLATVTGSVVADDTPVQGARIHLRAKDTGDRYQARSDVDGEFTIEEVVHGKYSLTVVPTGPFRDHAEEELNVAGVSIDFRVVLERLGTATIRGRMLDVDGEAVPGFSLWLTNLGATSVEAQQLTGDAQGGFELAGVATGRLDLATRSDPRFRVSGVVLTGSDDPPVELVLDVGRHSLEGRVFDKNSNAVPGARVSLIWAFEKDRVTSHSVRHSICDSNGYFRFSELGRGLHTVNVSANGFQRRQVRHEVGVGGELRIELPDL